MELKVLVAFLVVLIETTSARRRCHPPISPPPPANTIIVIQTEAPAKDRCGCASKCAQYEELILPPMRAELPRGLGYFPTAVPLVASCFNPAVEVGGVCSGASIPVTSQCSGLTLATPISPDWAPLVRPIIL